MAGLKRVLGLVLLLCAPLVMADSVGPELGKVSPSLLGRQLNEKVYRLKMDNNRPKVLNFFSVNCVPCREEMPELARLGKLFTGVRFVSVQVDEVPNAAVVKFIKSLPAAPEVVIFGLPSMKEKFNLIMGLPHTVVLDKNNIVVLNLIGYTPENSALLLRKLQQLSGQ